MKAEDMVFVGVNGRVLALDRHSGRSIWETRLKGSILGLGGGFVNLFFDRGDIFAHTNGRLFCLDSMSGRIKWENPLKWFGYEIATLASVSGSSGGQAVDAYKDRHAPGAD
jgi:outer membrane protein assembly factor BamB